MQTASRRSRFLLPVATALLLVAGLASVPVARADTTFVVDNVSDDPGLTACTSAADDCSLRGAVIAANGAAGTDTISFMIPAAQCPGGVCPITVTAGQMEISEAVVIDATTQPQNGGPEANVCATDVAPSHMRVELLSDPGTGLTNHLFLLTHSVGGTTIRGLAMGADSGGFPSSSIHAVAGSAHHIACNHFAIDAAGQSSLGSGDVFASILVEQGVSGIVIGTNGDGADDIGERNVFGSGSYPIYINDNDDSVVAGNYFGFTADGATGLAAGPVLVRQGSSNTIIGTNEDGVSDELERNFFGNGAGPVSLTLPASGADVPTDQSVVGNTFGLSPEGVPVSLSTAIEITSLDADETGFEIRDNIIVSASNAIDITADESGASVLVADNTFGVTGDGTAVPNGDTIWFRGLGSHVLSGNLIANSTNAGIVLDDSAVLAAGSTDNCIVGNTEGVDSGIGLVVDMENNWWGALDGPSGIGPGSGDSINADVDFTPWLTNPPDQCNTPPTAEAATFTTNAGASAGTSVGTAVATDDGADLTFAITGGDPDGVFSIGSNSGEIAMASTPDYPATPSYVLTVEATDAGSLSDSAAITVEFTNAAPVAADAGFTVAEDAAIGLALGTVTASDDDGDSLSFSITAGDPAGVFAADSDGDVSVAGPLDFETTPAYTLTVDVSDGFESDTATVSITVTDVAEVPTVASFTDVPVGHTFFTDIEWLADLGITRGCNPPTNDLFCPDANVTRDQMAAFLHRALAGQLTEGPVPAFTDLGNSIFGSDIEWLGATGVTRGCNPPTNDRFCPDGVVTREQMAAFLVRAMGYTAGAGSDRFTDDDGSIFEADIERLAEAGVTRGCNPPVNDSFCPDAVVTRAQMAAFLHRALG